MKTTQLIQFTGVAAIALILLVLSFGTAHAADISFCDAFPDSTNNDCRSGPLLSTNWNGTLSVPQFDPAVGKLTGIQIAIEGSLQGDARYENTGPNPALITATHGVTIAVLFPNNFLVSSTPSSSRVELVDPFDGTSDFAGPSGRTFTISATKVVSTFLTSPADLTLFTGVGNVTFSANATGVSFVRGPGNLDVFLQAQAASLVLVVTYIFERPASIDIEKFTHGRDADGANDADVPPIAPGAPVVWTYQVRNTGDTPFTLAEITVTDDQPGVTPLFDPTSDAGGDGILSPDEVWLYTATLPAQDLLNATAGTTVVAGCDPTNTGITRPTYENIGTVATGMLTDTDPSHYCNPPAPGIDIKKFTNSQDADGANDVDVPLIAPNATVIWTYLVTNTGNLPYALADVIVTDSQPGVTPTLVGNGDGDTFLAPNETWIYRATAPAQNLLNTSVGTVVVPGCDPGNTGTTRATYQNLGTVVVNTLTDFDPSHYCNPATPGIDIEKLVNSNDADDPNGADVPQLVPGQTVNWTYQVRNTGNISFTRNSVVVTDSQPGVTLVFDPFSDTGADDLLAPNETWIYHASAIVQDLDAPTAGTTVVQGCNPGGTSVPGTRATYRNIGTVTVPGATDNDPAHYCNPPTPGIDIKKLVNGSDANDPNGNDVPQLTPGAAVVWTYLVTNTGDIAFAGSDVVVTDSQTGVTPTLVAGSDNGDNVLSPGETWTFQATGIVQNLQSPTAGTVTVQGCNPGGTIVPGDRATYRNIGAVAIPGATDNDPAHYCNPPAPGIEIKKLVNNSDANDPNGTDVPQLAPGAVVIWTYQVTNTGNIAFAQADVVVTDSQTGVTPTLVASSDNGDNILSPGEMWTFRATGVVQDLDTPTVGTTIVQGCNPSGTGVPGTRATYRNVGTVTVPGATDNDPAHYCNPPVPGIEIKKLVNGNDANDPNGNDVPQLTPGSTVVWTYLVTNTGGVDFPLAQVVVNDSQNGVTPTLVLSSDNGDNILTSGETWTFRALGLVQNLTSPTPGTVVVQGCDPGGVGSPGPRETYRNVGTVTVPGATDNDPAHYCNSANPGIIIKKYTNSADADDPNGLDVPEITPNAVVSWTYRITNTGSIPFALAEITVTDDQPGVTPVFVPSSDDGDSVLSPGESWLYRATGIAANLETPTQAITIVAGCDPDNTGATRPTYENIGTVVVRNLTAADPSHYCNETSTALDEEQEPAVRASNHFVYLPVLRQ